MWLNNINENVLTESYGVMGTCNYVRYDIISGYFRFFVIELK